LVKLLKQDSGSYTWVAATIGSNSASGYQLATGDPVMAIGGFNGTDPAPTLAQFIRYVRQGQIHYFIPGGGMGMRGNSDITGWVKAHYDSTSVGGVTVYDLSG
jgi:4-amino-4-deoxy-L-arabinose transferase-like glycosyltransferase